jgi:hypothetical protein
MEQVLRTHGPFPSVAHWESISFERLGMERVKRKHLWSTGQSLNEQATRISILPSSNPEQAWKLWSPGPGQSISLLYKLNVIAPESGLYILNAL